MTERTRPTHVESSEKPFHDKTVYYSGSIKGAPELDPDFAWKLVQFMSENGADVLSEHVAARSMEEMDKIRAARLGERFHTEIKNHPEPHIGIRRLDLEWVDAATHMIALVNAPSHGVGIEIEHALLKPRLGLNSTPILCLVHEENLDKLSPMIRGATEDEFYLKTYTDLPSAQEHINHFLTGKLK
jgi:hypothetical protein